MTVVLYHNVWNHPVVKYRSQIPIKVGSTHYTNISGTTGSLETLGFRESQRIITERNATGLLGLVQQDVGGPFESKKVYFNSNPQDYVLTRRNASGVVTRSDRGPMVASDEISRVLREDLTNATEASSQATLDKYCPALIQANSMDILGATAVNRSLPTQPLTDVSVFLAELMREGYPFTGRDLGSNFNPGSLYLNYQFGVAPTADAIAELKQTLKLMDARLIELGLHSGQLLRRQYHFDDVTNVTHKVVSGTFPVFADGRLPDTFLLSAGTRTEIVKTTTKVWWSGAFKYYVPDLGTWRREISDIDNTLGVVPDVNTLYNLTPWSWLVEYFSSFGTMVENLSSFGSDGLVMPWSYIMATQEKEVTHSWVGDLLINNVSTRVTLESRYTATTLQRRRASPFGFGFDTDGLNDRQKLILAALGISRL